MVIDRTDNFLAVPNYNDINGFLGLANNKWNGCNFNEVEITDVSEENSSLSISSLNGALINTGNTASITFGVSINFTPPDPTTIIKDDNVPANNYSQAGIILGNTDGSTREVDVNTSGLINVQ